VTAGWRSWAGRHKPSAADVPPDGLGLAGPTRSDPLLMPDGRSWAKHTRLRSSPASRARPVVRVGGC
jgi:hypothetical protein